MSYVILFLSAELFTALAYHIKEAIPRRSTPSSDDGSPCVNGTVKSEDVPMHGYDQSITIEIPPFSVMYFTVKKAPQRKKKASAAVKKTGEKKTTVNKTTKKTNKKS